MKKLRLLDDRQKQFLSPLLEFFTRDANGI
jgi:hypothetical protein